MALFVQSLLIRDFVYKNGWPDILGIHFSAVYNQCWYNKWSIVWFSRPQLCLFKILIQPKCHLLQVYCRFLRKDMCFNNFYRDYEISSRKRLSWSWSYGSWIYNYLCNQCLSRLKLWVWTPFVGRCTRYNIMWSSLSVTCDKLVVF